MEKLEKIWMDGNLIAWDAARVHVLTHTLHYGVGAFEGIRAYRRTSGETAVFRLREHIDRLFDSCRIVHMKIPFEREQIVQACADVIRANRLDECYLRPLAFMGDEQMGLYAPGNTVHVTVVPWHWGAYLGAEGLQRGIRAKVSSFVRAHINATMAKGKVVGNYVNSIMAKREVKAGGYDEAIMLDAQGYVAEASGENLFIVRNGVLRTAPTSSPILEGVTRDTVIKLAREMGYSVNETLIARDELYISDEIFLTGTAAEITPVREVDDRTIGIGARGPITEKIQARYFDIVKGSSPDHAHWRHTV